MTRRIVRDYSSVTDSCVLLFFEIKSIDFFILGFASSILGFPGAQKDTMLDTQGNCKKVSVLSTHR